MKTLRARIREALNRRFDRKNKKYLDASNVWRASTDALIAASFKKTHSCGDVDRYRLTFCMGRNSNGNREPFGDAIWWETKYGIVLTYRDRPIALLGFSSRQEGLLVIEVQGVKGEKQALAPLYWDRLLYKAVFEYAKALGVPEVAVCPAYRNIYYGLCPEESGRTEEELAARRGRMEILYDKVPLKSGYKPAAGSRMLTRRVHA